MLAAREDSVEHCLEGFARQVEGYSHWKEELLLLRLQLGSRHQKRPTGDSVLAETV